MILGRRALFQTIPVVLGNVTTNKLESKRLYIYDDDPIPPLATHPNPHSPIHNSHSPPSLAAPPAPLAPTPHTRIHSRPPNPSHPVTLSITLNDEDDNDGSNPSQPLRVNVGS